MSYDLQTNETFVAFDKAIEAIEELHQALQNFRRTRKYKFLPTMGAMTSDVAAMTKDLPLLRERFSDNLDDAGLS